MDVTNMGTSLLVQAICIPQVVLSNSGWLFELGFPSPGPGEEKMEGEQQKDAAEEEGGRRPFGSRRVRQMEWRRNRRFLKQSGLSLFRPGTPSEAMAKAWKRTGIGSCPVWRSRACLADQQEV